MIYNHCEEESLADYGGIGNIAPFEFDDITHECDEIAGYVKTLYSLVKCICSKAARAQGLIASKLFKNIDAKG